MGFYIQGPKVGKGVFIKNEYGGEFVPQPESFDEIPEDKALICVVNNGLFEAAGYCFSAEEFEAFVYPDERIRHWLLMDKDKAQKLSGFPSEDVE